MAISRRDLRDEDWALYVYVYMYEERMMMKFKPGDHADDYRYLFQGHWHVLTRGEIVAWRIIIMRQKGFKVLSPAWKSRLTNGSIALEEEVDLLLKDGEEEFYAAIFRRVLKVSAEELNTCPVCGSLCRTHLACLCPHCSHSWYEERREA